MWSLGTILPNSEVHVALGALHKRAKEKGPLKVFQFCECLSNTWAWQGQRCAQDRAPTVKLWNREVPNAGNNWEVASICESLNLKGWPNLRGPCITVFGCHFGAHCFAWYVFVWNPFGAQGFAWYVFLWNPFWSSRFCVVCFPLEPVLELKVLRGMLSSGRPF